jgi:hypothetical protein
MSLTGASIVALWLVTGITVLTVAGLVRQNKVLEAQVRRLSGPGRGMRPEPRPADVRRLAAGADAVIALYVDAQCSSCDRLLAAVPALAADLRPRARLAIVPLTGALEVPGADVVVADASSPLRAVDVPATPYAVAWTGQGSFRAAAPVGSEEALHEFLAGLKEGNQA